MRKELTVTLVFALALIATALGIYRNISALPLLVLLSGVAIVQIAMIAAFVKRMIVR